MPNLNKEKPSLDLQSLDVEQIIKILSENQDYIIRAVLIVGTLLFAGKLFNDFHSKDQAIRAQMTQLQTKLQAIKDREAASQGLASFKSSLPKVLNEFEFITLISDYAKIYNISIPSLSPVQNKGVGLFDTITLPINAETESFNDLILFLRKIEKSDVPIRIESWSGNRGDNGKMLFRMSLTAVLVHI